MKLRLFTNIFFALLLATPALAVTDKEMEEAKTITAQIYLRWSNDGSGYLDEVKASTMAQLEAALKDKEKENLKAFKAVKIPSDYASWDKNKLVEFWSSTFFTSSGLSEDGKRAKNRVKTRIQAMNIDANASKKEEQAAETKEESATNAGEQSITVAEQATDTDSQADELLADQEAIAEDAAEAQETSKKKSSNSLIYIIALCILGGVVIWLMIFAANTMKKSGTETGSDNNDSRSNSSADESELRSQFSKAMAKKNAELENVTAQLKEATAQLNDVAARLSEAEATVSRLTEENDRYKSELEQLKSSPATPQPTTSVANNNTQNSKPVITEIFLGRANARGQFVRGDRRPNPEHTIYRLTTVDGIMGSFQVVDTPEAIKLALSDPLQNLAGGCNSNNFEEALTATGIITDTEGSAFFDSGCWNVFHKARIRFK